MGMKLSFALLAVIIAMAGGFAWYFKLTQAKIDNIKPQEILDQLVKAKPSLLSELITIILNANRYKSSRLGVRKTLTVKETVSRNIID